MSEFSNSHHNTSIVFKVNKVIYHDNNTGRVIMSATQDDGKICRVLGKMKRADVNWVVMGDGSWKNDVKYGWQFEADFLQIVSSDPTNDVSEYLECKVKELRILKAETGFASAQTELADGSTLKLSGRLSKLRQGATICVYGKRKHNERYGDEFQVALWEYKSNETPTALSRAFALINSMHPSVETEETETNKQIGEDPHIEEEKEHYAWDPVNLIIPDWITIIDDGAFSECNTLTDVVIPNSVTSIGKDAFKYCGKLHSVTIPTSVKYIAENAFEGCTSLEQVKISCKDENDFFKFILRPDSIFSIYELKKCYRSIIINDIVQESITIPDSLTEIPDYALFKFDKLTSICIPRSIISIGDLAFGQCTSLRTVTVSNSIESISKKAFSDCDSIEEVKLCFTDENDFADYLSRSDIQDIFHTAICPEAKRSILINGVEQTSVIIPDSVTDIGNDAFHNCSGITSMIIPNSVIKIGTDAFEGCCFKIENRSNAQGTHWGGLIYDEIVDDSLFLFEHRLIKCKESSSSVSIPNCVTSIGKMAFKDCALLTSITIPNSVTHIGNNAFSGCIKIQEVNVSCKDESDFAKYVSRDDISDIFYANELENQKHKILINGIEQKSIIVPDNVTSIGSHAFAGCLDLTSITIPETVRIIGDMAFKDCCLKINNLGTTVDYPWGATLLYDEMIGDLLYVIDNQVVKCKKSAVNVTIPDNVTGISPYAFNGCQCLASVTIGNGVASIDESTFENCPSLTMITFGNSVLSIGSKAFQNCKHLTSANISNSVTSIGMFAFAGCSALTSITIPDSVKEISYSAFKDCQNLTSVTFGKSVKSIGMYAFTGCSALTSINIPNGVEKIPCYAFLNCESLKSVTIPESVTKIGSLAFDRCDKLTEVKILGSFVEIGRDAFWGITRKLEIKTLEVDWADVKFDDSEIRIPKCFGGIAKLKCDCISKWMNRMRKRVAQSFPKLIVHYYCNSEPEIENPEVLNDVADILNIKHELAKIMAEHGDPSVLLKLIGKIDKDKTRIFIPRDKTPYLNFLDQNQALSEYPIIPVEEVVRKSGESGEETGKTSESGALYTLVKEGQPYIVWENNKDSRATFVFRCTRENYTDKMNMIFNFIMSDKEGKRQYLHTDASKDIFGEKPTMIVHNDLESWSARLMMTKDVTSSSDAIVDETLVEKVDN